MGETYLDSSVAQWQSIRLLTGGLLVRVQPEEPIAPTTYEDVSFGAQCGEFCGDRTQKRTTELDRRDYSVARSMRPAAWPASWTYLSVAPVCALLPFVVPNDARPSPVVLTVGVSLCVIAVLLAAIHRQHDLRNRTYGVAALSYAIGASLTVSPAGYWIESVVVNRVLSVLYVVASVFTASALLWLAVRMWRLHSKLRVVLSVGVGLVALRFAWSASEMTFRAPASIEEISASRWYTSLF